MANIVSVPYSALVYDRRTAQYRGASGRFLPRTAVRDVLDSDIDATKARMLGHAKEAQKAAQSLLDGTITQPEYIAAMAELRPKHAQEIKALHLCAVAAARGGVHALEPADYLVAAREIKAQYGYWEARVQVAASDPEYGASEKFVQTVASYGEASRTTYETVKLAEDERVGLAWEFNELDDNGAHCKPKDSKESCQQQTDKGVVRTGTLVKFGGCVCGPFCRCLRRRFKTKQEAEAAIGAL